MTISHFEALILSAWKIEKGHLIPVPKSSTNTALDRIKNPTATCFGPFKVSTNVLPNAWYSFLSDM
jgi:hypothetical protein